MNGHGEGGDAAHFDTREVGHRDHVENLADTVPEFPLEVGGVEAAGDVDVGAGHVPGVWLQQRVEEIK